MISIMGWIKKTQKNKNDENKKGSKINKFLSINFVLSKIEQKIRLISKTV